MSKFRGNRISNISNTIFNFVLLIFGLSCSLPFLMMIFASFTDETSFLVNGFLLWPKQWSLDAYKLLFAIPDKIINSYLVTIYITVIGTVMKLIIDGICAYALSRKEFRYKSAVTLYLFIPVLFNGGLLSYYLVITRVLQLSNNLFAMILPALVSPFAIIVMRTYIQTNVPDSIIESAKLDGAGEATIFFRIIIWMVKPIIAIQGLAAILGFWNEWFNSMLFITDEKLYPLQRLLIEMQRSLEFLTSQISNTYFTGIVPAETYQFAVVAVTIGPIILIYPFIQKYFVKGLTAGAVKQ